MAKRKLQLRPFIIHPFLSLKKITGTLKPLKPAQHTAHIRWVEGNEYFNEQVSTWNCLIYFVFERLAFSFFLTQALFIFDELDEMNAWIHKGALEASSKWPKAINQKMPLTKWLHHFIPSYCCLHKPPVKDTFVGIQLRRGGWTPLPLTFFT